MPDLKKLLETYKDKIIKSIDYLEYSLAKVESLPTNPSGLDYEQLETWESFAARFARVSEIFLAKYIRTFV